MAESESLLQSNKDMWMKELEKHQSQVDQIVKQSVEAALEKRKTEQDTFTEKQVSLAKKAD